MSEPTFPDSPLDPRWGDPLWPDWVKGFRPHQVQAIGDVIGHYADGIDLVILDAPTGCLAGSTQIGINRGGKGFTQPIDRLVHMQNGGATTGAKTWRPDIVTNVQTSDGLSMRLGPLAAGVVSGEKVTYRVCATGGRVIRATLDHLFMTPDGWARLGELSVDDKVQVLDGQGNRSLNRKSNYLIVNSLHAHPYCGRRDIDPAKGGHSVARHRLVAEARLNDLSVENFIARIRSYEITGLTFLDPEIWHVHHADGNSFNNEPSNLVVLSKRDHQRLHAHEGRWRQVSHHIGVDTIMSIEKFGLEPTFDLKMATKDHNFIANGFVVHNSGKTVIAEAVRRLLAPRRTLYVANTNSLLDQFMSDFGGYAKPLKGRSNYPTHDRPDLFSNRFKALTAGDCTKSFRSLPACSGCDQTYQPEGEQMHCDHCHPIYECPYEIAKREALTAPLAVTNTAYFVTEVNGPGQLLTGPRRRGGTPEHEERMNNLMKPFVIVDECDTLESILMSHAEVRLSKNQQIELGLDPPTRKTVETSWIDWCGKEALPKASLALSEVSTRLENQRRLKMPLDLMLARREKYLVNLVEKLTLLNFNLLTGNAVYDGYKEGEIIFRSVRVNTFSPGKLWKHGRKWLCMSASVVDPIEFVEGLGVEKAGLSWAIVTVPSTFPKENRPIHVKNAANMVFREKETEWPKMIEAIKAVLTKHPNDRTLIHTVSYGFSQYVFDGLRQTGRPILVYSDAKERESVLATFRQTPGAVLLAPSMDRGIDLPGDECRVIIVTKMPFMSTQDKQVNRRIYSKGGQLWYNVQTIRSLIQMTGRGVRSETDTCVCYILDKQFMDNVWRKNRHLFPQWWKEALDWSGQGLRLPEASNA